MLENLPLHLLNVINKKENSTTEFKEAKKALPKSLFETVCAFLNRNGGNIFLGISDNGKVTGVDKEFIDKMKKDFIKTENANRAKMIGNIDINAYEPYPKNPKIAKLFKEIGLADELGSGVKNMVKYTKLYSGGIPEFREDDIFRTIIPISKQVTGDKPAIKLL